MTWNKNTNCEIWFRPLNFILSKIDRIRHLKHRRFYGSVLPLVKHVIIIRETKSFMIGICSSSWQACSIYLVSYYINVMVQHVGLVKPWCNKFQKWVIEINEKVIFSFTLTQNIKMCIPELGLHKLFIVIVDVNKYC